MRVQTLLLLAVLCFPCTCVGQTKAPAFMRAPRTYLMSCECYSGSDLAMCRQGQSDFIENYKDALVGRLDSWRNLAFLLTASAADATRFGIKPDGDAACTWRLSVVFTGSVEINELDLKNAEDQCSTATPQAFALDVARAREAIRSINILSEDDPRAPWNIVSAKIDPKCLDSSVVPFGAQSPQHKAGCPPLPQ